MREEKEVIEILWENFRSKEKQSLQHASRFSTLIAGYGHKSFFFILKILQQKNVATTRALKINKI